MKKVGRPKGLPKTGGREKGVENKTTEEQRQIWSNFSGDYKDGQFKSDWERVEPETRLKFLAALLNKLLPSVQSVNLTGTLNADQMQQLINSKFPFGGIDPAAIQQKLIAPDDGAENS